MLQYREIHDRHTSALKYKNTQIQTHVHSRGTFKYRVAHTNRDIRTQTGTHTTKHAGTVQGGAGDCGPSRPLPPHAAAANAQKFTTDRLAQTF